MQQIGTISTNIWYSVGKDHAGIPTWSGAKGDLFFSATGLRFPGCGLGTIMSDFYVVKMQMMHGSKICHCLFDRFGSFSLTSYCKSD